MNEKTKALLLGVSLRWINHPQGVGMIADHSREARLTEAATRLTINTDNLEPTTLQRMLVNPEEVLEWLASRPRAVVVLGAWQIMVRTEGGGIESDCPFLLNCVVESFSSGVLADGSSEGCWILG